MTAETFDQLGQSEMSPSSPTYAANGGLDVFFQKEHSIQGESDIESEQSLVSDVSTLSSDWSLTIAHTGELIAKPRVSNHEPLDNWSRESMCYRCRERNLENRLHDTWNFLYVRVDELNEQCPLCIQLEKMTHAFSPNVSEQRRYPRYMLCLPQVGFAEKFHPPITPRVYGQVTYLLSRKVVTDSESEDEISLAFDEGKSYSEAPDLDLVRQWLSNCHKRHAGKCAHSPTFTGVLRLLDCRTRKLVVPTCPLPYICLSYVWGAGATQDPFREELPPNLPKTIEDAIFVADQLDIPYLWVDKYCINQADKIEQLDTISQMSKIYQDAEVTIVAAVGNDPYYGLPGICGTPRKTQQPIVRVGRYTFAATLDPESEILGSRHATRGWTYQEVLLSNRRLVFTSSGMYYQCQGAHFYEPYTTHLGEHATFKPKFPEVFPVKVISGSTWSLTERLEEYFKRTLTYNTDIVHAFTGIFGAFDDSHLLSKRLSHFYGIPILCDRRTSEGATKSMLTALHWSMNRRPATFQRTGVFPSWSWASAKADLPPDEDSYLDMALLMHDDTRWLYSDAEIHVEHLTRGRMSIQDFMHHSLAYNACQPWIELESWVLKFDIDIDTAGDVNLGYDYFELRRFYMDDLASHRIANMYAICLGVWMEDVTGLMLEEIQPGLFRRLGVWRFNFRSFLRSARLDINLIELPPITRDIWEAALAKYDLETWLHRLYRLDLIKGEYNKVENHHWSRRTVKIV